MAEPGLINSKYRILYEVGGGGMGKVYAVVHEALGTTYALKQLRAELENNPEIASRFRHEAQMMARLQHPNIVRVFDIDSAAGFGTYLVMEFIEGIDLGKLLRREGRLPDAEVLKTGRAVASALETAHAAGLVHRDIKPANILIEEKTKRAVVTDFGIAKQIESEENVTRTGSFIGTYRYCSPEQIRNERAVRIDGRADVYSLGVVLYEMCSGERFLEHMSEMQIAHHVGFGAGWKPELGYRQPPPAELASLIEQCLAREREDRPTAAEMVLRLEHCLLSVLEQESATRALPAADQEATRRVPPTAPRSARRRRLTGWAMAAGTAAALLAALWLAGRRSITAPAPENAGGQAAVEQPAGPSAESGQSPRIASFSPATGAVQVRTGEGQPFSVDVEGGAPGADVPIEWRLDGSVVAEDVAQWKYRPDRDAAGKTRELQVAVAGGAGKSQSHSWKVKVAAANRPPVLAEKPAARIEAPLGETVDLRVRAQDPDGDPLTYAWKVDGEKAGTDSPELRVAASGDRAVSLTVSDGKDEVTDDFRIAAIRPVRLALDFAPKHVDHVRLGAAQSFRLIPPAGTTDLRYAWTVDGEAAGKGPSFDFEPRRPDLVRKTPVTVAATATNAAGLSFSHEWKVEVRPPPPSIDASSPSGKTVEVESGESVPFELQPSAPVGDQAITVVYEVDGHRATSSPDGRFEYRPKDDQEHRVVAYAEDNYRQESARRVSWNVRPSSVVKKVQHWLDQYETAWNRKDAKTLAELRGLKPETMERLEDTFKDQNDLRVRFSNVRIEKVGSDQAKASYDRVDQWVGARDGKPVSRSRSVQQMFRVDGSRVREMDLARGQSE
jgi:tRNA A-37 threonylcarbamoyl transferase component Bud32